MNVLDFSLAEVIFRVRLQSPSGPLALTDPFGIFLHHNGDSLPDATYEAFRTLLNPSSIAPSNQNGVFWENDFWRVRVTSGDTLAIEVRDASISAWRTVASMADDFSQGRLLLPPPPVTERTIRPFYHPQDRAVILGRFCHVKGVMMHASSVLVDGHVLVFAGMSGAGKTTLARLFRSHGATILNDERTLIHERNGTVRAGASPWHGEENQVNAATGPLGGIFFLKQAPSNRLRPLPLPEGLANMMTTAFVPVFIPDGTSRTLDNCMTILNAVQAYELCFTKGTEAMDLCRSVIHS